MGGKVSVFLMVGLMVSLCTLTILAQAEEQKAQLFFVEEVVVKPSMLSVYEAAIKEMVAYSSNHKYQYPWYAYSTNDFHYYYVFPMENLSEIENIFKAWGEISKIVPEEQLQTMMKNYQGTYEYYKYGVFRQRPDLSYTPESPRLKPEEANFMYWGFCYLLPGKEKEFEENSKKWVDLYKSKNISNGWNTFIGDIGTDMPFYFWTASGKSAADFWSQGEKETKILGEEEVMKLEQKDMALYRKYESKTGRPRPDLSYIPKEK